MAYIITGLTNGGVTAHYKFSYDQALAAPAGPEPARTNAVIAACEADYNLMHGWFGGGVSVTGMSVQVTTQSNGASWSGSANSSTIQLKAQGASFSNNPAYLRYLIIAEVVEIFMMAQNIGWFQGSNEGSKGEGLSRFLSGQFLAEKSFLGLGIDADYAVADLWLNSVRQDFVNNAPDDNGYDATNGCTTLFIYYLCSQLGYSINQIVAAGSSTLAGVYKNLTGDGSDPFPLFKDILDLWFPSQTSSAVAGPNFDDPWPLLAAAYTGVWRSGSDPYYLWTDANQSSFLAKWQTLAAQNLRLTDLEVTTLNGQQLWSGIWEEGTDAYYLWIDADESSFLAKWQTLAAQNLRLVSIKHYDGLWAGVWRHGSDAYYLWIDADEASFLAKWSQLASQNLRLVDFDVYTASGQTLWAGVWREGSDGYYLWIDASWSNFVAKWSALAAQNLRLVGVREYNGLWAGIWRSGKDGYYLWANVSEANFLAKWSNLAGQNLRLIDMIAVPLDGSGGATGALALGDFNVSSIGERIASSEMTGRMSLALGIATASTATEHGGAATGRGGGAPSYRAGTVMGDGPAGVLTVGGTNLSSTGDHIASSEMTGRVSRPIGSAMASTATERGGAAIGRGGGNPFSAAGAGAGGGSAMGAASLSAGSGKGGGAVSEAAIGSAQAGVGGGNGALSTAQITGAGHGGGEVTVAGNVDEGMTGEGKGGGDAGPSSAKALPVRNGGGSSSRSRRAT